MKDLMERLRAAGVHTLLAQFTDIHGVAKGKLVPLAHLDELLTDGAGFSGPSIAGTGLPRIGPARRVLRPAAAPAPATRAALDAGRGAHRVRRLRRRRALRRLPAPGAQARRWRAWPSAAGPAHRHRARVLPAAPRGASAGCRPTTHDRLDKPSYDLKSLPRQMRLPARAARRARPQCGLDVLQLDHEDAHGQYELNFGFADALASADHLMLFKLAAQALAEQHGMVFSMMPKPFANQPGSGMHFHVSLWEGEPERPTTRTVCSCRTAATAASTASAPVAALAGSSSPACWPTRRR